MVLIEKNPPVATVTINRPEALNALNTQVLEKLSHALDDMQEDDEIFVVVFTGAGKAFVAGADVAQMASMTPAEAEKFSNYGNAVFMKLDQLSKPTIAAVNGYALGGGCELALACDMRICSSNAKFGQPEVKLGIIPGFGGTQRLPRLVGQAKAMEMILSGRNVDAQQAAAMGLVNRVCQPEKLMDEVYDLAKAIAENAQVAVRTAKKIIKDPSQLPLSAGVEAEAAAFGACFATQDQKLAMDAFVKKEKTPKFLNK